MSVSKFINNLDILFNHNNQDNRALSLVASLDKRIQKHKRIYKMDVTDFILSRLNSFRYNCKELEDLINIYNTTLLILENMVNNKYLVDYSIIIVLKNNISYHEKYQRHLDEFATAMKYFQMKLVIREYSNGDMGVIRRFPRIHIAFLPTEYYEDAIKSSKTYFAKLPADIKKILNGYIY